MAALVNNIKIVHLLNRSSKALMNVTRNLAAWNKDYKPGPFPRTGEERIAAAKKYNMLPEEYRPHDDEGNHFGDYPKVDGGYGIEARDPFYPWDFPEHKRNYNEIINDEILLYNEDRWSVPARPRFTNRQYWLSFLGVMTTLYLIYHWLDDKRMFRPVAEKQYPGEGKTHYSFDVE